MTLRMPHGVGAVVLGAVASEAASSADVPLAYYAATIGVLGFVGLIVKAFAWVDKAIEVKINAAFQHHNELDDERAKGLERRLVGIEQKLDSRPCAADCTHQR